ncbi:uncharacterized protein LOC116933244 isoform X1 [Daphnia magna]|uniref:uncharacterized protein LOC116933244 isoform X1 n=1 Tax=Daphnia magna TaxID=35525 RepID=UPI001E1BB485|nr:uncharacterized protein LOC116933244 isoform X1 [Daphnia magna]
MNDINDLANVMVTEQNFLDGVFPWDSNQNLSFKDNFKLVDCWMLYKRNTEQILQCKLEMSQFITTISEDILSMQHEITKYNSTDEFFSASNCPMNFSVFQQSEIVIKTQEVKRLEILLSDSLAFKQYFYEENLDDDDLVFEDDCMDDDIDGDGIDKDDLCDEIECSSDDDY